MSEYKLAFLLGLQTPAQTTSWLAFFFFLMFILEREREKERAGEGQRERGTEDLKQAPHRHSESNAGFELMNYEIMT